MKRLKLFIPLAVFAVIGILLLRGLEKDPTAMPSALIDRPVPEFSLRLLKDPQTLATKAMLEGPALMNVWATWCQACRIEHPFLNQLAGEGVSIYGINYKDDPAAALQWLEKGGDPYRFNLMDIDGILGFDLGVFGAPETYVIDSRGVIRYRHVGVLNESVWRSQIKPLLTNLAQQQ